MLFEEGIKSKKTLAKYNESLNTFLDWARSTPQNLIDLDEKTIQITLEDYIIFLKRRDLSYSFINLSLSAIFKFLDMNDKVYNKTKLRRLLPEKKKASGKKAYTTQQIQTMLGFADTLRNKSLIHFYSATGCRSAVVEELKFKHLLPMPDNCYAVTCYAGSNHEYITFLHQEARGVLDQYLEERRKKGELIQDESFVFPHIKNFRNRPKAVTGDTVNGVIWRILQKAKIQRNLSESGKRYDTATINGFRKRFNTILKNNPKISYAIAERMMDHSAYLEKQYHDTSDINKFFEEYKKAIPDLLISSEERLKLQISKQENESEMMKKYEERLSKAEKLILKLLHKTNPEVNPEKDRFIIE